MAGTVNHITVQVQILEVAALTGNCAALTGVTVLAVLGDHVLSTAGPHISTGILNIELETPHVAGTGACLQRRLPLPVNGGCVSTVQGCKPESARTAHLGEVTSCVHRRVIGGGVNAVHSAVELRTPLPVDGAVAELNASTATSVGGVLRRITLHVGEVTADVQVTVLHLQGLHLCCGGAATFDLDIPGLVNLAGGRIQDHEVVSGLPVHLGEFATHGQTVTRQSLNSLNLAVELGGKRTHQLAAINVITSKVLLVYTLTIGRLNIGEVAAGEDGVTHLSNSLHVGVHLAHLTGCGLLAGAPTYRHGVAVRQGTTVTCCRTNLAEVQITLGQFRSQIHLGEGDRITVAAVLLVNIRAGALITAGHISTIGETNTPALVAVSEETYRRGAVSGGHLARLIPRGV